ncbi:MAG: ribosome-associated translation inhibitor RaiA [Parcubacteria group bacterium]|nr:ribosome-associated translation inhibitor RaiA [Parcubacteria group bacterium]
MDKGPNIVIKIKMTGIDLTPAIEEYTRAKINSLQKFFSHFSKESGELLFEVEIGKTTKHHLKGDVYRAEINFNSDSTHMRSEATKDDLYAAIDEAKDEMSRELRRDKRKAIHLLKRGGAVFKKLLNKSR